MNVTISKMNGGSAGILVADKTWTDVSIVAVCPRMQGTVGVFGADSAADGVTLGRAGGQLA